MGYIRSSSKNNKNNDWLEGTDHKKPSAVTSSSRNSKNGAGGKSGDVYQSFMRQHWPAISDDMDDVQQEAMDAIQLMERHMGQQRIQKLKEAAFGVNVEDLPIELSPSNIAEEIVTTF